MSITAVILAAGQGTRMRSRQPKVLHKIAGKPLIEHVIDQVRLSGISKIVLVLGYKREEVTGPFLNGVSIAVQPEQLGTGHAVMQARDFIDPADTVFITSGDTPLLRAETIKDLLQQHQAAAADATVMSAQMDDPAGYGRIIRSQHNDFLRIVEEKDAQPEEKLIQEVNAGIYCIKARPLFEALKHIENNNAQNEYYLPDVLPWMSEQGHRVNVFLTPDNNDVKGINDRVQLAEVTQIMQLRINNRLMRSGVTIINPLTTYIEDDVTIGADTVIYPNTIIAAGTVVGEECSIGPDSVVLASKIGNRVLIEQSRIDTAVIEDDCHIGPFAYLRPETHLASGVKVGDFVEIKKSFLGSGTKAAHLSYIGDATIGQQVNIGAGTITCNYDGQQKHPTIIGDEAFIGSNSNLVAPVSIGDKAIVGAGSTITEDVPAESLGLERAQQIIIAAYHKHTRN